MGQREIDNFNRNAADFMARFGTTDKCRCAQCVKVRREGDAAVRAAEGGRRGT